MRTVNYSSFIALFVFPLEWIELVSCESMQMINDFCRFFFSCVSSVLFDSTILTSRMSWTGYLFTPPLLQFVFVFNMIYCRAKKCDWLNYSCQPNSLLFRNCFSCAKIEKLFSEEIGNSLEQKHMHPKYCCTAPCQCECVLCFVLFRPKADWKENTLPAKRKSSRGYYYMVIQFLASIVCT